jgi:hypothetical protein
MINNQSIWTLWSLLGSYCIVIPRLQRDYAQGRIFGDIPRIRYRFLDSIFKAFEHSDQLILDFVYGEVKQIPSDLKRVPKLELLDGQQRLTTLFLLHWYSAVKEDVLSENISLRLSHFSYETRNSAREFCQQLASFNPKTVAENGNDYHKIIKDQNWFLPSWERDPTICGMLVTLGDIAKKFDKLSMWEMLTSETNPIIGFHFQQLSQLGMSEDLYIRMNSRGKQLTEFENVKARLLLSCKNNAPEDMVQRFRSNIDTIWTDIFWSETQSADETEQAMESYLSFLLMVTRFWAGNIDKIDNSTLFDHAAEIIRGPNQLYNYNFGNFQFIMDAFDCWKGFGGKFKAYFSEEPGFPKESAIRADR